MNRMPRNLSLAAILLLTLVITGLGCQKQIAPAPTDLVSAPEGDTHTIYLPGDVPLELVRIPAGTFMMGSPEDEQDRQDLEGPRHQRTIDAFCMGKYTVTKAQWDATVGGRELCA